MQVGIGAGLLVLALGCGESAQFGPQETHDRLSAWAPDDRATLLRTDVSGLEEQVLTVVSDPTAWRAMWTQAWTGSQALPILPQIDFVLNSVVVVGLGRRAGPGYSVAIDSIVIRTTGSVLYATASQPGRGCDVSTGLSTPVHMVRFPGHPPIVDWRIDTTRRDCPSVTGALE